MDTLETLIFDEAAKHATGKAVEYLSRSAKRVASKIARLGKKKKDEELAQEVVDAVLAESAAFPPTEAVQVYALPIADNEGYSAGIHPPDAEMIVPILWLNRADFPVFVADMNLAATVSCAGLEFSYTGRRLDQEELEPREHRIIRFTVNPRAGTRLPKFGSSRANVGFVLSAVVMGPWTDQPHSTQTLSVPNVWLPVFMESSRPEYDEEDILAKLETWFKQRCRPDDAIECSTVDHELRLPEGSSRKYLEQVAKLFHYEPARIGANVIRFKKTPQQRSPRGRSWIERR